MGKTKVALIDDSAPAEIPKKKEKQQASKKEQAKSETQEIVARGDAEESSQASTAANGVSEDAPEILERQDPESIVKKEKKSKKAQKQSQPKHRSKKYQEASEKVEKSKKYPIDEAVELAKQVQYSKFDGSLELHINTSVKNLRGLVSLPFASGKKMTVLAFGQGAQDCGADMVGDDDKLAQIMKGKIDFDVLVTDPTWMAKLARAAKVLGPRGLMPNPKSGTITDDLKKAVSELQSGKIEYKTQKDSQVIHLSVGKISQPSEELSQNIKILLSNIGKTKIKVATIAPSMGPGVKLDTSSL